MTPMVIKLCECLELNPVPILMSVIVSVNVGATATPLGHTPNLLITGNHYIAKHGVSFLTYTLHMFVGVVLCMIHICIHLRVRFNDIHELRLKEPKEIKNMRREITVWERTAASLSSFTKDSDLVRETLMKKVQILKNKLRKKEFEGVVSTETYIATLDELKHTVSASKLNSFVFCFQFYLKFKKRNIKFTYYISVCHQKQAASHQIWCSTAVCHHLILHSICSPSEPPIPWMVRYYRSTTSFNHIGKVIDNQMKREEKRIPETFFFF